MALGVVFGLACSLMLKHSRLNEYPGIESCLVILIAYTSYFFSNGLTMSGECSLFLCWSWHGLRLSCVSTDVIWNMYHTRHRITPLLRYHTQALRLSQHVEKSPKNKQIHVCNTCSAIREFHFYLSWIVAVHPGGFGLQASLHHCDYGTFFLISFSASISRKLIRYIVSSSSTVGSQIAACAARWMAVFPISKLINVGFRARGQRSEELPQSYQMMLFWAGLRGAVGVALAAGIKGHNAKSLRTTVLVTVVISLVFFGGTIGRMVEITGIKTGVVEDDDESSDDEGGPLGMNGYRAGEQ
jgi:sodium/hydrogen exchanger-like protein 6/7